MALRRLGADFEHYRSIEFDKYAMASYNAVHGTNFEPTDINDVKGVDLGIVDKSRFTYLLTYSFPCFVGDTMVMTKDGLKFIKDVVVGDEVLTHTNTYKKVVKSQSTGIKEIYCIDGMCFDEIRCTPNTQCYKQFGNSIVVSVLCAIFSMLNIRDITPWNDRTLEEQYELTALRKNFASDVRQNEQ